MMVPLFDFRSASKTFISFFQRGETERAPAALSLILADSTTSLRSGEGAGWEAGATGASGPVEPLAHPLGGWPKRMIDVIVAVAALLLVLPVMALVAIIIRLTTGGPAIFTHQRIGYGGKSFGCFKFRTMVPDADKALAEHLARDPAAAAEWAATRKLRHDPRVTRLGHLLRKSSLDELPQLFNILRGDMSCVGPRPIVREELDLYGDVAGAYLSTRPGLTGLWQVTGRSSADFVRRVSLDSQYVRNWSLMSDLLILAKTSVAVMRTDEVC